MRAMRLVSPGDLPVFQEVDVAEPLAGGGEVVVRVVTASLDRRDWWIWREASEGPPMTLGSDAAGVVVVTRFAQVGNREALRLVKWNRG
jgi:NADPH:quinone reductase-like Zn-dependent oxidoreductase